MKIFKKIMAFFQRPNKPDECYLKITNLDESNIQIDFSFSKDSAHIMAATLYQLDSGLMTGFILDGIKDQCIINERMEEYNAFMTSLSLISMQQMDTEEVSEALIKPSQVFKYVPQEPKLN